MTAATQSYRHAVPAQYTVRVATYQLRTLAVAQFVWQYVQIAEGRSACETCHVRPEPWDVRCRTCSLVESGNEERHCADDPDARVVTVANWCLAAGQVVQCLLVHLPPLTLEGAVLVVTMGRERSYEDAITDRGVADLARLCAVLEKQRLHGALADLRDIVSLVPERTRKGEVLTLGVDTTPAMG